MKEGETDCVNFFFFFNAICNNANHNLRPSFYLHLYQQGHEAYSQTNSILIDFVEEKCTEHRTIRYVFHIQDSNCYFLFFEA